ncbi:MAG: hypothetical protein U1F36_11980 [Planctomycetota bacterium]
MRVHPLVVVPLIASLASVLPLAVQDSHAEREVEGFRVLVAKELLAHDPARTELALRELQDQLYRVTRVVPDKALAELRKVPIWMSAESKTTCAAYHPSREWLAQHEGYDPRMAEAVEIGNLQHFLDWTHEQPFMLLHELAHAFHHRVLGYGHRGILDAFARAKADARWSQVLRSDGSHEKHYALTDEKEWFAEASESFFGTNDFFPFVHAELHELDAQADDMLAEAFGAPKFAPRKKG